MREPVVYADEVLRRLKLDESTREYLRTAGIPKTIDAIDGLSALGPDEISANENPRYYFAQMDLDPSELQPSLPLIVFMTDSADDMIAYCVCLHQTSGSVWQVSPFYGVEFVNSSIACFVESVREWEEAISKCKPGSYEMILADFARKMRAIDLPAVRSFRGFWSHQIAVQVEEYD